ncbi:MAG TPA: hypothetical protein VG205_12015 [Acidimicrobiales bacterium]|nr:hypothetical protein [Acidimicrobiales bacterium]
MSIEPSAPSSATVVTVASAVVVRPRLWLTALGAVRRLAAPGWWRRRPFLPLPDGRLWGFRMVTAYGRADAAPDVGDVISYLEWCRAARGSSPRGVPSPGAGRRGHGGNRPSTPGHG